MVLYGSCVCLLGVFSEHRDCEWTTKYTSSSSQVSISKEWGVGGGGGVGRQGGTGWGGGEGVRVRVRVRYSMDANASKCSHTRARTHSLSLPPLTSFFLCLCLCAFCRLYSLLFMRESRVCLLVWLFVFDRRFSDNAVVSLIKRRTKGASFFSFPANPPQPSHPRLYAAVCTGPQMEGGKSKRKQSLQRKGHHQGKRGGVRKGGVVGCGNIFFASQKALVVQGEWDGGGVESRIIGGGGWGGVGGVWSEPTDFFLFPSFVIDMLFEKDITHKLDEEERGEGGMWVRSNNGKTMVSG